MYSAPVRKAKATLACVVRDHGRGSTEHHAALREFAHLRAIDDLTEIRAQAGAFSADQVAAVVAAMTGEEVAK